MDALNSNELSSNVSNVYTCQKLANDWRMEDKTTIDGPTQHCVYLVRLMMCFKHDGYNIHNTSLCVWTDKKRHFL